MKQVSSTTAATVALNKPLSNGRTEAKTRHTVLRNTREDEWRALNLREVHSALEWRDYESKHTTTEECSSTPIGLTCRTNIAFDEKVVREFERRVGYLISTPCEETRHMLISLGF